MTTIAVRGRTLAADTIATCNGTPARVNKILDLGDRVFGVAGNYVDALMFLEWVKNPKRAKKPKDDAEFVAVELRADGSIWEWGPDLFPFRVEEEYYAIGSGQDVARGAMYMGATAEKAVEAAIRWDVNSGGAVVSVTPVATKRRGSRGRA